jgi:hypothetical protein
MSKPSVPAATATPLAGPSREARRLAAVLLEVLAGARTTGDAAATLGISLVRYYQVEARALQGWLAACEPRSRGRGPSPSTRLALLEKEKQRLTRELARQQSLVRLSQRALGLPPPAVAGRAATPGKRKRRPTNRALRMAERLREGDNGNADGAPSAVED